MSTENRPKLHLEQQTEEFKVFKVTAKAGMEMPEHISTKEAVVAVQKGKGLLKMQGQETELREGEACVIPGGIKHSLIIQDDFQAIITMAHDSEIKF